MTSADERFWERVHRRMVGLQHEVTVALLRALAIIRGSLSEAELARIIAQGALSRILTDVLSDQALDRALIPFRRAIHETTERGFALTTGELPRAGKVGGVVAVHFDPLSPTIASAVRELETSIVDTVKQDVRGGVLAQAQIGIKTNTPAIVIARQIPGVVGLGPVQVEQANTFRQTLIAKTEKPLTSAQVDRAVATYTKDRIANNVAATSSTATRQSYKTGQDLAWKSAQETGVVKSGEQLFKKWLQIDRATKRLSHAKMAGIVVPFDEPYPNGEQIPGEDPLEYNCGCLSQILVKRDGKFITPPA